jgi:hypothetical protein
MLTRTHPVHLNDDTNRSMLGPSSHSTTVTTSALSESNFPLGSSRGPSAADFVSNSDVTASDHPSPGNAQGRQVPSSGNSEGFVCMRVRACARVPFVCVFM